jgi:hypothetical protein
MFAEMGELEIFRKAGLTPGVLLAHGDRAADAEPRLHAGPREHGRAGEELDNFRNDPDWKKLAATPGYTRTRRSSRTSRTIFLRPASYSQI